MRTVVSAAGFATKTAGQSDTGHALLSVLIRLVRQRLATYTTELRRLCRHHTVPFKRQQLRAK